MSAGTGKFFEMMMGWVRWTGATGAILQSRGVTSVTRNGAGDFNIVVDVALDVTESRVHCEVQGVTALEWAVVHTSDTSKQFLFLNNAAAATDPVQGLACFYQLAFGTGL